MSTIETLARLLLVLLLATLVGLANHYGGAR